MPILSPQWRSGVRTVCASEGLMTGPGEQLFDFMADKLKEFMVRIIIIIISIIPLPQVDHDLVQQSRHWHLGFTFSFPTVQHGLASADLATWTKVDTSCDLALLEFSTKFSQYLNKALLSPYTL